MIALYYGRWPNQHLIGQAATLLARRVHCHWCGGGVLVFSIWWPDYHSADLEFASMVSMSGFAYGLDEGILTCVSLKTGERMWKQGRFGHGQLLLCDQTILVQCESGEIKLVAANPDEFQLLQTVSALSDRTWNHPVLTGGYLLVRNDREAVCFKLCPR